MILSGCRPLPKPLAFSPWRQQRTRERRRTTDMAPPAATMIIKSAVFSSLDSARNFSFNRLPSLLSYYLLLLCISYKCWFGRFGKHQTGLYSYRLNQKSTRLQSPAHLFLLPLAPSLLRVSRGLAGDFPLALPLLLLLLFVFLHVLGDEVGAVQVVFWLPRVILAGEVRADRGN